MGSQSDLRGAGPNGQRSALSGQRSALSGERSALSGGRSARCIALVGPYLAGKTTLLEAILERTGGVKRAGRVDDKSTVGDASAEARAHGMSVELNIADATFLGDTFTFIDCPGSVEFQAETLTAIAACDAAVIVCEPDPRRLSALQVIFKHLDDAHIPHLLFLNKIDTASTPVRDILPSLQPASAKPLVLRQIPIWENGPGAEAPNLKATGFVDLALDRAFLYRPHATAEVTAMPPAMLEREKQARFHMLEQLADYDDALMEQLLADTEPPKGQVFEDLNREFREGLICPVLLGSAEHGNGIMRLLKALRHDAPFVATTARRMKLETTKSAAYVFKTLHTGHGGKLSVARVLTGTFADGALVCSSGSEERIGGIASLRGADVHKHGPALAGDTVAFSRLDRIKTGDVITLEKGGIVQPKRVDIPAPVFSSAIVMPDRRDEVKLSAALTRLVEEDPSLTLEHTADTQQVVLAGHGEMHLRVAFERLQRKYGMTVDRQPRRIPYRETIRAGTTVKGRHKKQTGGHGQFGDVTLVIRPLPRGSGILFDEKVVGGAVPRQFISSVEIGVRDYMSRGPLGFPVIDVAVTLTDGSSHSVDSSDMAFRQAARLAMSNGMTECQPVLLEPVMAVQVIVPNDATARVTGMVPQRRGQITGYDARPGWSGWDIIDARIPQSELADLIIELRSMTSGVGTYTAEFDHYAELTGRLADAVLAPKAEAAE
jgi:elongation factor G